MKDVFGQPFKGPIIPFGSLVEYYPITADCSLDTLCTRVEFGKGDVLVADVEELEDDGRIGNLLEKTQCE